MLLIAVGVVGAAIALAWRRLLGLALLSVTVVNGFCCGSWD